jgi:hypothetical protein
LRVYFRGYICEAPWSQAIQRRTRGAPLFQGQRYSRRQAICDITQLRSPSVKEVRELLRRARQRCISRQEALAKRPLRQRVGQRLSQRQSATQQYQFAVIRYPLAYKLCLLRQCQHREPHDTRSRNRVGSRRVARLDQNNASTSILDSGIHHQPQLVAFDLAMLRYVAKVPLAV